MKIAIYKRLIIFNSLLDPVECKKKNEQRSQFARGYISAHRPSQPPIQYISSEKDQIASEWKKHLPKSQDSFCLAILG